MPERCKDCAARAEGKVMVVLTREEIEGLKRARVVWSPRDTTGQISKGNIRHTIRQALETQEGERG